MEVETSWCLCVLHTDNEGESIFAEFEEYWAKYGVKRQHMTPYKLHQNGGVEQWNKTVVTMPRNLLKSQNMPTMFWGEAVTTAVSLLNRAPTKVIDNMASYEDWHGRMPSVHFLRTFECVVCVKMTKLHLKKLDDRDTPIVLRGYEPDAKTWCFYDATTHHIVVSRDTIFD